MLRRPVRLAGAPIAARLAGSVAAKLPHRSGECHFGAACPCAEALASLLGMIRRRRDPVRDFWTRGCDEISEPSFKVDADIQFYLDVGIRFGLA